jgi:hypothetical protein
MGAAASWSAAVFRRFAPVKLTGEKRQRANALQNLAECLAGQTHTA